MDPGGSLRLHREAEEVFGFDRGTCEGGGTGTIGRSSGEGHGHFGP
jgi:hypothetical protein